MKKKTAAIWLSVVLCAAMLAGCGNAKGDDSGTQTGAAAQAGEAIPEEGTKRRHRRRTATKPPTVKKQS